MWFPTEEDINKNVWESENGSWYFAGECEQPIGPYDTRGEAVDAYIEYVNKEL